MFPVIFFLIALIFACFRLWQMKKRTAAQILETFLVYFIISNIAVSALFSAFFQIFKASETAEMIGFTYSPFEFEVAMANVGIAVAALFSLFWRGRYLFGPVIANTIFIYGAAYGHFVQEARGNVAPYNTGIFLWIGDLLIPTIIAVLALLYYFKVIRKNGQ